MPLLDAPAVRNHLSEIVASDCLRSFSITDYYLHRDARRGNWKSWLLLELARKSLGVNAWYPGAPVWYKLERGKAYPGSAVNSEKCDLVFEQYKGKEPAGAEIWVELSVQKNGSVQEAKGSIAEFESNINRLRNVTDELKVGKVLMALAIIKLDQNNADEIRALIFENSIQNESMLENPRFFVRSAISRWTDITDDVLLNKWSRHKDEIVIGSIIFKNK